VQGDSLLFGHPEPISLVVVCRDGICRAHRFVFGLIGGARRLHGWCGCALVLLLFGGAALPGPVSCLAAVVTVALAAFLLSSVQAGCCEGFICSPLLFPSLAQVSTSASTLQALGLLVNLINEGVDVNGGGTVDYEGRRKDLRCECRKFAGDPSEYGTFVLLVCNMDASGS